MGLFAQFFAWLQAQLSGYIGANVAVVASAIEPAAFTLATCYVMIWGYMHLTGSVQEPIMEGAKRIFAIVLILGIGIRLWMYNSLVVDTFVNGPSQLAQAILGAANPVSLIDQIWRDGNKVGQALITQGSLTDMSYYLAAVMVYAFVGLLCVASAALLGLSMIFIAVLLALGPVFIVMLLFDATRRFFEHWVGALANYALVTILVAMVASLLLGVVRSFSASAVASGAGVSIAEAARLCIMAVLIFLVVRQVPSVAASLSAGVAMSTFGAVSRTISWAFGSAKSTAYQGARGVMDGWRDEPISRWDSLRRSGGNLLGSGMRRMLGGGPTNRGGTLVPRNRVMPPPRQG